MHQELRRNQIQQTFRIVVCFVLMLWLPVSSSAADSNLSEYYMGMNFGRTYYTPPEGYVGNGDPVFGGFIGYAFNPTFSGELSTNMLSFPHLGVVFPNKKYYASSHFGFSVVANTDIGDRVFAFGKVGLGRTKMKSDWTESPEYQMNESSAGIGLAYKISGNWGAQLSGTRYFKNEVTSVLVGIKYQF